jgi:hypothetical protein
MISKQNYKFTYTILFNYGFCWFDQHMHNVEATFVNWKLEFVERGYQLMHFIKPWIWLLYMYKHWEKVCNVCGGHLTSMKFLSKSWTKYVYITNLACDKLIIKIVQSSFIYKFVYFTHEYHALKTCLTHGYMCWQMKCKPINDQMSYKFYIFQ